MPPWESYFLAKAGSLSCGGTNTRTVHAHVLHPDGKAAVYLSGKVVNAGVPAKALRAAQTWIGANAKQVRREWATMNNPRRR